MFHFIRKTWDLPQRLHTPREVFENRGLHRREFLRVAGIGAAGVGASLWAAGCRSPTDEAVLEGGAVKPSAESAAGIQKAKRDSRFEYGRPETTPRAAAEYTNFFEFSPDKDNWRHVDKFQPFPWKVEIGGLCAKPMTLDVDDISKKFSLEERAYRHRCVETWAMCVPWSGFPLKELLKLVEPSPSAKFVAFETFNRPAEAAMMADGSFPWPYTEGITLAEAANDLAFLATGVFGKALPKQHGAPIRLVVPWKYGFKSCKSIARITLTDARPATFWNTLAAHEYGFEANVDPNVPHPRWSQRTEWMLGTRERYDTQIYNGYGDYVGGLYS